MASYGFVYLINHDLMPGVYKIGYTDRSPMQRLHEISSSTSVPPGFNLVYYAEFQNASSVEASIHEQLKEYRVHESREFFILEKSFVLQNLFDWMQKSSINITICTEFHNLQICNELEQSAQIVALEAANVISEVKEAVKNA